MNLSKVLKLLQSIRTRFGNQEVAIEEGCILIGKMLNETEEHVCLLFSS